MNEIMNRRLELGGVTDGDGIPLEDEAIIFFVGDDGSSEIKVNALDAPMVAARIVELWNAALALSRPPSNTTPPRSPQETAND